MAFLRDIFEIQAIKGINSGMCVALSSPKVKAVVYQKIMTRFIEIFVAIH